VNWRLPEQIIEAEILRSKGKLTGIRFAGTLVLALMFLSMPATWLMLLASALMDKTASFDKPFEALVLLVGSLVVVYGFGYIGYRLLRRAFE
jgi:hypothetical protein